MRTKSLLVSTCLIVGFLVTAPVSIARDNWALSGDQKEGICQFNGPEDECEIGQYPTRDRGEARRIAGFYIDPSNDTPLRNRNILILYQVKPCNSGWETTLSRRLSSAGNNWIGFDENICEFRYGLRMTRGEIFRLKFEMNYYLDY